MPLPGRRRALWRNHNAGTQKAPGGEAALLIRSLPGHMMTLYGHDVPQPLPGSGACGHPRPTCVATASAQSSGYRNDSGPRCCGDRLVRVVTSHDVAPQSRGGAAPMQGIPCRDVARISAATRRCGVTQCRRAQ